MEVHAHTHTPRKKWTHYLWEFLMLFLAVFCGFLAENQREHFVEHQREKQFIRTLIEDVNDDIVLINEQIIIQRTGINQMDSLIDMLGTNSFSKKENNQLYYYGRIATRGRIRFFNNDRTIEQMKNSGGFRLIRDPEVSKRIMSYYRDIENIKMVQRTEDEEQLNYQKLAVKVFEPLVFKSMVSGLTIRRIETNPPLLTSDPMLLKELAGAVQYMNGSRHRIISEKEKLKSTAVDLVKFLKKKYHLE